MIKKREKKKFIRQNLKLQNVNIDNIDSFDDEEIVEEKRATKKTIQKSETSQKSNLELKKGRILEVKTNHVCLVDVNKKILECTLSGRLKQIDYETRRLVAVGDFVNVDFSDIPRIEEILPRRNVLSRFSEENFQKEVILASNIDQVIITTSVQKPEINLSLLDRYICAARISGIIPIICVNKIDLAEDEVELKKQMRFYADNDIQIVYTSAEDGTGMPDLKKLLMNKNSVFSGHSGTGKSSIINFLQPELNLRVSEVSDFTSKGMHTTTSARLLEWDFGGYLVDTPGIKTFGLHREEKIGIYRIFPGIDVLSQDCKFLDCSHEHELDCAVKKAVENNEFPGERYQSYLRLINSL
ncbi:MAG: ribosome small subunit-dependent GTPase A [Candidatus Cloacimonadales bacterium]|nr:ribosome small subunit-dependent GTPase A [Candidatus Cloacimonadales bacterium]